VNGKVVVDSGRLAGIDEAELFQKGQAASAALIARAES
jgi:hypothetical protein